DTSIPSDQNAIAPARRHLVSHQRARVPHDARATRRDYPPRAENHPRRGQLLRHSLRGTRGHRQAMCPQQVSSWPQPAPSDMTNLTSSLPPYEAKTSPTEVKAPKAVASMMRG